MPQPGDSCSPNGSVDFTDKGQVLICRSGNWQRVGEASPMEREIILDRLRDRVEVVSVDDVIGEDPEDLGFGLGRVEH